MLFDLGIVFMAWVDICVAAVVTTAAWQFPGPRHGT